MLFQEILTRDFRLQVFFMSQCPSGSWVFHWVHFEFFQKSRRYSRMNIYCLSPVSMTSAMSCSPVSTTLAINSCHGFLVWKKFILQNLSLSSPTTLINILREYLREFSKKFEKVLMGYSHGPWRNWFMKKIWSWKFRVRLPLIDDFVTRTTQLQHSAKKFCWMMSWSNCLREMSWPVCAWITYIYRYQSIPLH